MAEPCHFPALSRINIRLALDRLNASKRHEIPFHLFIILNAHGLNDAKCWQRFNVDGVNLNHLLAKLSPKLQFSIDNLMSRAPESISVAITIDCYQDFHPNHLVLKVPELARLLAMRNALKELKSFFTENGAFSGALNQIVKHNTHYVQLKKELSSRIIDQSRASFDRGVVDES